MPEVADNRLSYRRQFLLHSVRANIFPAWQNTRIGSHYFLEVHPDLEMTQVEGNRAQLTLLGFMIDPDHPDFDNEDILNGLLPGAKDQESLPQQTKRLSGRWILIAKNEDGIHLFNDPSGLRSVFFTKNPDRPLFCASQPGLIADLLGCSYSRDARVHFLNSRYFRETKEFWWPSGFSLYDEIAHLVPNHRLDLETRAVRRFWPWEALHPIPLEEGVKRSSVMLKHLLESAASRYEMALPLTGGLDSRTLLASTTGIRDRMYYYTLKYWGLTEDHPDIRIPKRLLTRHGLPHNLIDCSSRMDDPFRRLYMSNVDCAHEAWGHIAYGLRREYPSDRICVKGNVSEVARCFFYPDGRHPAELTGESLAHVARMKGNRFAIKRFDQWLSASAHAAEQNGLNLLDLFYWEHRMGSWQAMSQLEWDIVQETYTPFNCLELLSILLSVDVKYRKPPHYTLYKRIIQELWPDLLGEPINPKRFKYLKHALKILLTKTGLKKMITSRSAGA